MVMDATQPQQPSPQSVGREFVRQYYTLLNKAPNHLHRFYNNNSSFIHGESTLVVGQKNIHNRIQQLNFHDCHAKISQVDAQATLGNGVVVQVTGELSNDGQPMRRFTQTFVLAAQSPKKYYVHNDIFRYQDMYSDEEVDGESRSENDDDHEQQQVPQPPQGGQVVVANATTAAVQANEATAPVVNAVNEQPGLTNQVVAGATAATGVLNQQAQTVYYPMPAAGGRPMAVLPPPPGAAPVAMAANFANAAATAGVPPQAVPAAGVTQLNGVVAHDELITNIQQPTVAQQPQLATNQAPSPVLSQAAGTVSVGNANVLGAQTPAGVTSVPVAVSASAATGLPQTAAAGAASAIPNYQQSPLMPTHILQQQPQQQQPQQPLPNTPSQLQQQQTILQQQSQTPLSSGTNMVDVEDNISSSTMTISSNAPPTVNEQQQPSRPNTAANVVASGQTVASTATTVLEPTPAPVVEDFKTINEQQQQEKYEAAKQQQQQQNEPKTYANLFKSSSSSPSSFVNAAMQQQQQIQQQQQQQQQQNVNSMYHQTNSSNISSNTYSQSASSTSSMPVYGNRSNDNSTSLRQDNNNSQTSGGPLPQRTNAKGFNKDFDQRRTSNAQQFGDSQQLFLGNIPHHASEEELKALFSRFGQVVDLRILSKGSSKLPPGARNPLNYGFITYNDAEAVQNCLANCPLYFPDSPDGQKLNVEEKKPRTRPNDMPPRQSMGGGSGMNNMNNNQRNMSGGPPSRSLSNSGSGNMMRGNSVGNNTNSMSRGGSSGGGSGGPPRMGGAFNRNDNRASNGGGSGGGGSQMRGGNNNSQTQGNSYSVRR